MRGGWHSDLAEATEATRLDCDHDRYLRRVDRLMDHTPAADLPRDLTALLRAAEGPYGG